MEGALCHIITILSDACFSKYVLGIPLKDWSALSLFSVKQPFKKDWT